MEFEQPELPKRITAEWLRENKACEDQIELFKRVFPKGSPLTLAALQRAKKNGRLRVEWLASRLSPQHAFHAHECWCYNSETGTNRSNLDYFEELLRSAKEKQESSRSPAHS